MLRYIRDTIVNSAESYLCLGICHESLYCSAVYLGVYRTCIRSNSWLLLLVVEWPLICSYYYSTYPAQLSPAWLYSYLFSAFPCYMYMHASYWLIGTIASQGKFFLSFLSNSSIFFLSGSLFFFFSFFVLPCHNFKLTAQLPQLSVKKPRTISVIRTAGVYTYRKIDTYFCSLH